MRAEGWRYALVGRRGRDDIAVAGRSAPSQGSRLVRALAILYAGGAVVWTGLGRTTVAHWWPFQLVEVFNAWLYLPLPLLLLAAWLRRDWRSGAWLMLPLLIFVGDYGSLFLPRAREAQGIPLRVMSANLHYSNGDAVAFSDLLRERQPDVVALQELGTAMAGPLADRVRDLYPYQVLRARGDPWGMGVLSRHPFRDWSRSEVDPDCGCQQVALEVGGRLVTLLNIHPVPPSLEAVRWGRVLLPTGFGTGRRSEMILGIGARARATTGPLLIAGDLNTTDREAVYSSLGRRYRDVYREVGWGFGFTFPAHRQGFLPFYPLVRIDYVFHDDSWVARAARVVELPGSDHRGLIAEVTLRQTPTDAIPRGAHR